MPNEWVTLCANIQKLILGSHILVLAQQETQYPSTMWTAIIPLKARTIQTYTWSDPVTMPMITCLKNIGEHTAHSTHVVLHATLRTPVELRVSGTDRRTVPGEALSGSGTSLPST